MAFDEKKYMKEYGKKYRLKNKDMFREYFLKNKDKILKQAFEYRLKNKYKFPKYRKEYRIKNRDKLKESGRNYYIKNKAKILKKTLEYRLKNKDRISKKRLEYKNKKYYSDINYRLAENLRSRLRRALVGNFKSGSAVRDLGCTIPELKTYLESQFEPGMTWENHSLFGWHIDHRIPLDSFDLTDREQFLKACYFGNLHPMWWRENLVKSDKILV